MALAGPLTSLSVGILCWLGVIAIQAVSPPDHITGAFVYTLGYLAVLNVMLFAFNLLPAFPMDGGRVLRAWLAKKMPLRKATKIAADVGKGFAILFAVLGIIAFNPILIIIAFFIYIGAGQEFSVLRYQILLKDLTIGQVMNTPVVTVSPELPVPRLIELMYTTKHLGFPVVDRGQLIGIVALADVQKRSTIDREALQVRDIMTREVLTLPPDASLIEAFKLMSARQIGHIPVTAGGAILGIVTRTDILRVMELQEI
jgi:CBS domain-containing protein